MNYSACVGLKVSMRSGGRVHPCRRGKSCARAEGMRGPRGSRGIGGRVDLGGPLPFLSSIVTVSFAHFMRNLVL